jgi:hypothetical protein
MSVSAMNWQPLSTANASLVVRPAYDESSAKSGQAAWEKEKKDLEQKLDLALQSMGDAEQQK